MLRRIAPDLPVSIGDCDRERVPATVSYDLELRDVRKVYGNGTIAVERFDLRVERGEFISFVGPSGCGKTTTLRMIAGFEAITAGEVLIRGQRINELPAERRPTSTIFQNFALFPHMSVQANIEYGLAVKGLAPAERRAKARGMIEKLELADVAARRPDGLSGGQRQRVALARSLVVEPEILLLDEPLGALDANLRKSIQNELKLLQRNLGITFVFVTHAQSEALVLSDRVVVMNRGTIEQLSTPYELYRRPKTPFVARFIGRNALIGGRMIGLSDGLCAVDTPHGALRGRGNGEDLGPGDAAIVVVPSEAIDIHPAGRSGGMPDLGRDANGLSGQVISSDVVGHTLFLVVRLGDGAEVRVESHVARYAVDLVAVGCDVALSWAAEESTIIRQD